MKLQYGSVMCVFLIESYFKEGNKIYNSPSTAGNMASENKDICFLQVIHAVHLLSYLTVLNSSDKSFADSFKNKQFFGHAINAYTLYVLLMHNSHSTIFPPFVLYL